MVDLPEPLGPTRPIFSPRKTAQEASMKRICRPCCLETESRRNTGGLLARTVCGCDPRACGWGAGGPGKRRCYGFRRCGDLDRLSLADDCPLSAVGAA